MSTRPVILLDGAASASSEVLGHKGHGIDMMRRNGLPVPPAFCITAEVGARYRAAPDAVIGDIWDDVLDGIRALEAATSRTFGSGPRPLLISVRSGAAVSMPGMMDTLLDLGFNDDVENALAAEVSSSFARDSRRRFSESFTHIVTGAVPDDPFTQLRAAIEAVFDSWDSPRATAYRSHHGLDDRGGTAVVVQAMVFGNLGPDSGAGVIFSRNPITGAEEKFGEWLPGGQGDDVVSGTVDVEPIIRLREQLPAAYAELVSAAESLERLTAEVQEIEFTIQAGTLWLLQTRAAKRSAQAAVRLALQLLKNGLIDEAETLRRVTRTHVEALLRPSLQPETRLTAELLATGLPAGPGVASGRAYTEVDAAIEAADRGEDVILVRHHTSPDDIHGMLVARGIVTETGGATSHAAVVSRELGRAAVVGCGSGVGESLAGRLVTVDGNLGEVRSGSLELSAWSEDSTPELRELADVARRVSPLRAHASGDYPRLDRHSEIAVRTAMAIGHHDVVSDSPLLAMLEAIRVSS